MPQQYDVIVIGSGPVGGTCPPRGCNLKKVLVGTAGVINRSSEMQGKGIAHGSRIDWPELIRFKRNFTEPVSMSKE